MCNRCCSPADLHHTGFDRAHTAKKAEDKSDQRERFSASDTEHQPEEQQQAQRILVGGIMEHRDKGRGQQERTGEWGNRIAEASDRRVRIGRGRRVPRDARRDPRPSRGSRPHGQLRRRARTPIPSGRVNSHGIRVDNAQHCPRRISASRSAPVPMSPSRQRRSSS